MQVLYVDTLFFVNFALDFLSLYLAGLFVHAKKSVIRFLLAATIGGIYAVAAVIFEFPAPLHFFLTVLMAALLCRVAFRRPAGWRTFIGYFLLYYVFSVLLGGAVSALYRFLEDVLEKRETVMPAKADIIVLFGFLSAGVLSFLIRFFGGAPKEKYATVLITAYGKTVGVPVLIDSGCLLSDPISGRPAIIVRLEALTPILPRDILSCARPPGVDMPKNPSVARRCRLLSARSLGKASLLLSFRPDRILLDAGGEKRECDALIALFEADKNYFGGRDGLLPASLLLHS